MFVLGVHVHHDSRGIMVLYSIGSNSVTVFSNYSAIMFLGQSITLVSVQGATLSHLY